ncbi:MAG: acetate/propionate family kinase [Mesorhizobium sp.]
MSMNGDGQTVVFNAGSSSIKFAVFDAALNRLVSGQADAIGGDGRLTIGEVRSSAGFADHASAVRAIFDALAQQGFSLADMTAAGHRVVHGGREVTAPSRLTPEVIGTIEQCVRLAPLHNPHNLTVIRALAAIAPDLPQFASFDTAFHTTNPEVALRYAVPDEEDAAGLRRFGFHGISFSGLVRRLPALSGAPLPSRLLALHLGNGVSLCAIRDGRSVATTMGYSPLDGLTMGTRTGGIDGNAVLKLAERHGIEGAFQLLNKKSGLLALGGHSDMRALRGADTDRSRFAIEHFSYWALRHSGSMIAAMGGIDALAFTGGIGENDTAMRASIMSGLSWTGLAMDDAANEARATRLHCADSKIAAWIVPADEEQTIAEDVRTLMGAAYCIGPKM